MKKRTLALILAVVLMLSVAIPGTLAVSQDSDSTTATLTVDEPVVTEAPETTETPEATETPVPEVTEAPEVTETPVPEVTETPEATETPAPEVTEAPEATETPAAETPDPEATEAPEAPAADLVSVNREAIFDPAGVTLYADIGSDDCVFADLPDDFTFTVRYEFADEDGALWYMLNTEDWADYPEYAAYPFITEEFIAFTDEMEPATLAVKPNAPVDGTTTGNPFPKGTGGSNSFRIPAMVTLSNGTIVAAADARWNTTYDGGGLDTIVARSSNGGASWGYTFANYLGDNGNSYNGSGSTAFIDPSLVAVGNTVYMLCDLYPYGVALNGSGNTQPVTTKGFDSNGRLLLSNNDHNSYDYYLDGDTIRSSNGTAVDGYTVDGYFDLYQNGDYVSNLFFSDSPYKVVRTGYLYLTRSTDGGATWSEPTLLNLKNGSEMVCLVGPGRGLYTSDGRIIFPVYSYNGDATTQRMGFICSADNGATWMRVNSGVNWSSEAAVVELGDGTLRFFYRNGTSDLCYVDYKDGWGSTVNTGIATNSNTQLSAIAYSKTLDGKQVILVSCPTGANEAGSDNSSASARLNGKIFVFTVESDGTLKKVNSVAVTENNNQFMYSCLTELSGGSVAILYEDCESAWGAGDSCYYTMSYKTYTAEALGLAEAGGDTGSNTMTDDGVTVTLPEDETITALDVTVRDACTTATTVSKSYDITINNGDYTGAATVTVPYDTAFDGCTDIRGTVGTDTFTVTRDEENNTFVCAVPHFSTVTVTGTRAAGDAGSESITLKVGETSNAYTLTETAAAGTVTTTDGVAEYTVANNKTEASTTVTYKNSISAGDQIVISDGNGNYLMRDETTIKNTTDPANATVWTVGGSSTNGYTLKSGNYYLSHNGTTLSVGTSSSTWSYDGAGFYYYYYIRKDTSNWTLDWYRQDNRGKAYTVTTVPGSSSTTVTFTGVKPGTTAVTLGGTTFAITVQALSETVSIELEPNGTVALDPVKELDLGGTGYTVSYTEYDAGEVITLAGSTVTAGEKTGGATVVATVKDASGTTWGKVTYTIAVTARGGNDTISLKVNEDKTVSINDMQDGETVEWSVDDPSVAGAAGVYDSAAGKYTNQAVVIGYKEGTAKVTGTVKDANGNVTAIYTWDVTVTAADADKNTSQKTVFVKVTEIKNCKVYYSINGGELIPVNGTGVLIGSEVNGTRKGETVTGKFNIMYFAAPDEGYALVSMSVTNSKNQYYCLSDGNKPDGTGSEAWPFYSDAAVQAFEVNYKHDFNTTQKTSYNEWNPESYSHNGTKIWKAGHGFRWALLEDNMSVNQMKVLFSNAITLGCDGVTTQTKNGNDGLDVDMSFVAVKLPEVEKKIVGFTRNGTKTEFNENTTLENTVLQLGDTIHYQFTVKEYNDTGVTCSSINLKDDKIGRTMLSNSNSFGTKGNTSGTDKYGQYTPYVHTADYTLNEADLQAGKYAGGTFKNEVELSYDYKSDYSSGNLSGSASGQVSCQISGVVSYVWETQVQGIAGITDQGLPAGSQIEYNKEYNVLNRPNSDKGYETVEVKDAYGNVTGTWRFLGWEYNGTTYQPGDKLTMPHEGSVVFTGKWEYKEGSVDTYKVTYAWDGDVPPDKTLPMDDHTYVKNEPYKVDTTYSSTTVIEKTENGIVVGKWTFSGWDTEDGTIVDQDIEIKGTWTYTAFTTDLTITKKIADGSDPDQSFVFTVTDGGSTITVALNPDDFKNGTASVTINGLTVGKTYTVTEDTAWSWRYEQTDVTPANGQITLTANGTNEVTFTNRVKNTKWLDDSVAAVNKYGDSGTKRFD